MIMTHEAVPGRISPAIVSTLIRSMDADAHDRYRGDVRIRANWNKVRAALGQLYSLGVALSDISSALMRDIEVGDRILSGKSDDEQNAAPETQLWLGWLEMYHAAQKHLRAIECSTAAIDLGKQSIDKDRMAIALQILDAAESQREKAA